MAYKAPLNSPYDPAVPDLEPETLPLDEILLEAMRAHTLGLRVALPAQVTSVTQGQVQQVDVQPMLMARYLNQADPVPMPVIKNVPVVMPMGQNFSIKMPLAVGDNGLLVFVDRSLDAWVASNATSPVDPQDTRQHDLTDGVFLPGLVPFPLQQTDATTDFVIACGSAQLRLQQTGRVKLGNSASGGQELVDLSDQLLGILSSLLNVLETQTFTLTQMGPQPFIASTVAALQQLSTQISTLRTNLDTIKGT